MTVRKATSDDAPAAARLLATVAEEGTIAAEPPVDVEARAEKFRQAIESGGPAAVLILEEEGRMVGHAGVQELETPGVFTFGMAVHPDARGRGGGRALLRAILEHARACGAHKVELEVWPDNARAIALYASSGFEVEGLRRDHYRRRDGTLRSALLMARAV
ncbi:MAG TPA: GNAT family N-acetyltransferase [Solirubrobacterales bacterium]|nr:GNAT family N-acetyltransferase [Solirubrobacterales bacterium]